MHLKDAILTQTPGDWGSEEAVGDGEVDWPAFFTALHEAGFKGPMAFEREAGDDRIGDVLKSKAHALSVLETIG